MESVNGFSNNATGAFNAGLISDRANVAPKIDSLIADNSSRFGLDARSLAADLAGLSADQQGVALKELNQRLSPTEQGELMRAIDQQRSNAPVDVAAPTTKPTSTTTPTAKATKPAAAPLGIDKLFGAEAAKLAAMSPSLIKDMKALEAAGYKVVFGPAGGGTSVSKSAKKITIDSNEKGNAAALVQSLSHEVGHARYVAKIDKSSRAAYIKSQLGDEGAATLSNIRARREILAKGGADIGIAGNSANHKAYNKAYDQYIKDGNAAKARDAIGAIFGKGEKTSTTNETYEVYYGKFYDKNIAPPAKK
jgi:hypothetical protein